MRNRLISILLPAAAVLASGPLYAASGLKCEARLSGAQEVPVPGVDTQASGKITAKFDAAFTKVDVKLQVRGAPDANRAHFHCARPGANGGIAFDLCGRSVIRGGVVCLGVVGTGLGYGFDTGRAGQGPGRRVIGFLHCDL